RAGPLWRQCAGGSGRGDHLPAAVSQGPALGTGIPVFRRRQRLRHRLRGRGRQQLLQARRRRTALCHRPCRHLAQWLRPHHHQPWQGPQRGRSGRHRVLPVLPGTNLLTTPKPIHLRRLCVHNLKVALILLAALFSASVMAETKIAVVDLGAAIFGSDIAQSRQKELQGRSEYATLQAKYDSTAADIKALQKDAEAKSMTWSDDQKTEFQKKMEYLRADIELTARKLESEVRGLDRKSVV